MNVIAVIPVNGRGPLVKVTVERLLSINGCSSVICIGHSDEDKDICVSAGAKWVQHENHPLGKKWNAGFQMAREMNADAVLFVGSSDWVSKDWIPVSAKFLDEFGMTGKAGCHLIDFRNGQTRMVYWSGYLHGSVKGKRSMERAEEPIGIGRMLSAKCLDAIDWMPFEDTQDNSLDWAMYQKALRAGFKVKMIEDDSIHSMAFSCDLWPNKHTFSAHWSNEYPSERIMDFDKWLEDHFPNAKQIFNKQ